MAKVIFSQFTDKVSISREVVLSLKTEEAISNVCTKNFHYFVSVCDDLL